MSWNWNELKWVEIEMNWNELKLKWIEMSWNWNELKWIDIELRQTTLTFSKSRNKYLILKNVLKICERNIGCVSLIHELFLKDKFEHNQNWELHDFVNCN